MNPFVSRINNQPWIWPVTGMCVVLGFMISMAWVTEMNRTTRIGLVGADQAARIASKSIADDNVQELQAQVNRLQSKITKLENALASQNGQAKLLNDTLQETKTFAGLTEVEGEGLLVTLIDDPQNSASASHGGIPNVSQNGLMLLDGQIIHDTDVLRVVNELFASGAEAVEVNKNRVTAGTAFRCAGTTVLVNDTKVATPIKIKAIGDAETLYSGMNMLNGILDEIRHQNPAMVQIQKVSKMSLVGFVGSTTKRFAKVPKDKK